MFEKSLNPETPARQPSSDLATSPVTARVIAPEGEPMEFIYKGRRFHVHSIVSRWRESGGWWNRIDDGRLRGSHQGDARNLKNSKNLEELEELEELALNDGGKAIWRVEAAPIGSVATFEIELDEITGTWQIRPTSRPHERS